MAKTQNFCHQLLTPKCEYLKCQRVREMRERDKEGEMENFIIIKGLKMRRRDAFFDPRGYKYINPLPYPPTTTTVPLSFWHLLMLQPLLPPVLHVSERKKSQCQIGVVLVILYYGVICFFIEN